MAKWFNCNAVKVSITVPCSTNGFKILLSLIEFLKFILLIISLNTFFRLMNHEIVNFFRHMIGYSKFEN